MTDRLDCTYYYNSRSHPTPPDGSGHQIDLAADPSAAHRLIRLGLTTRRDLPAILLAESGSKIRVLGLRLTADEAVRLTAGDGIPFERLRVLSSSWCPDCRRAKRLLDDEGILYEEVLVDEDLTAEALILDRSGGRRVVPTLLFDDRLFVFNPDPALLRRLVQAPLPAAIAPSRREPRVDERHPNGGQPTGAPPSATHPASSRRP